MSCNLLQKQQTITINEQQIGVSPKLPGIHDGLLVYTQIEIRVSNIFGADKPRQQIKHNWKPTSYASKDDQAIDRGDMP